MIDQNGKKTRIHVANPNIDLGEGIHDDDELGGLRNKSRGSNIMQFINHSKFKFRINPKIKESDQVQNHKPYKMRQNPRHGALF